MKKLRSIADWLKSLRRTSTKNYIDRLHVVDLPVLNELVKPLINDDAVYLKFITDIDSIPEETMLELLRVFSQAFGEDKSVSIEELKAYINAHSYKTTMRRELGKSIKMGDLHSFSIVHLDIALTQFASQDNLEIEEVLVLVVREISETFGYDIAEECLDHYARHNNFSDEFRTMSGLGEYIFKDWLEGRTGNRVTLVDDHYSDINPDDAGEFLDDSNTPALNDLFDELRNVRDQVEDDGGKSEGSDLDLTIWEKW